MAKLYFEPQAEDFVLNEVRRAKRAAKQTQLDELELSLDYLEGRQMADIQSELMSRFPSSMTGDPGQQIVPVTLPLTEKYVAESATAYNRTVTRTLTLPDGTENSETKEQSLAYNKALEACDYDEVMHQNDRLTCLLNSQVTWHSYKRNKLRVELIYPQDVYPVCSEDESYASQADPEDYDGFAVQLANSAEDTFTIKPLSWAYITAEQTAFYTGIDVDKPKKTTAIYANPFTWPQVKEGDEFTANARLVDAPLLPLVFWHKSKQTKRLFADADPEIALINREINIQWSMLFDTARFQGYDIPVKNLMNPDDPKAKQKHGARFPVVLQMGEAFQNISSSAPYAALVDMLKQFTRTVAVFKRMSANDFSSDGSNAISGFAKLVESLPKLEARQERIKRLKAVEENQAWQRNAAVLIWAGQLSPRAKEMRLSVKFSDVEFPKTADENAKELETQIKYGMTSPVKLIASKYGVSEEQARAIYEQNKADGSSTPDQTTTPEQPAPQSQGDLLGRLISMRRGIKPGGEQPQ